MASRPLRPEEAARVCFRRVQQIAERDGRRDVPADIHDFVDVGEVLFLNEFNEPVEFDSVDVVFLKDGRPVRFTRAIVTWETK